MIDLPFSCGGLIIDKVHFIVKSISDMVYWYKHSVVFNETLRFTYILVMCL